MASAEKLLSFADARRCVEQHTAKLTATPSESIGLLEATNRFLAEDIAADRDIPPFDRATRDGYALSSEDVIDVPATLKMVGRLKAGEVWAGPPIGSAECIEIMTGAPVPPGADAVVMVEYARESGASVQINRTLTRGENIVPVGSEGRQGQVVLPRGTRLSPAQIGLAAVVGRSTVTVHRKPRIAILSTGDEVVDITVPPKRQQVRNSNTYSLAAQVIEAGGEPVLLPIAPDEMVRLKSLIREGLEAELLLLSGGVSMGKYDFVERALGEFQAEFFFTGAFIQPGRPVVFGRAQTHSGKKTCFFGLPGNPVSTLVTFELFASCLVAGLAGGHRPLRYASARLVAPVKTKPGLTRFLPAWLGGDPAHPTVELLPWQGSGDMATTSRANCYLVVPPEQPELAVGDPVSVLLPGCD